MSTIAIAPEVTSAVAAFLTAVRTHLADLDQEEQREILDGLEADLSELVAEHGASALGDPAAYAAELRQAAGLDPERSTAKSRTAVREAVVAFLDRSRERTGRIVGALPGDAGGLLSWLRPVWWIARGWLAVELFDLLFGRGAHAGDLTAIPHLRGYGWLFVIVATAVSVQIGRGRLWPGTAERGLTTRMALLVLNGVAIALTPLVLAQLFEGHDDGRYQRGFNNGFTQGVNEAQSYNEPKAGLYADGTWVSNIYAYDAQGRPLVGVQLFNQIGDPINVVTQPEYPEDCIESGNGECEGVSLGESDQGPRVFYPWTNGVTQLFNVFPIPSRVQESEEPSPNAFSEQKRPVVGPFPLANAPKVSLPGIKTGVR